MLTRGCRPMATSRQATMRSWRWRRNPLRRHSDVIEAWVVLAGWILALVSGLWAGLGTANAVERAADQQRAERRTVSAVLAEGAEDKAPYSSDERPPGVGHRPLDRTGRIHAYGRGQGATHHTGRKPRHRVDRPGRQPLSQAPDQRRSAAPSGLRRPAGGGRHGRCGAGFHLGRTPGAGPVAHGAVGRRVGADRHTVGAENGLIRTEREWVRRKTGLQVPRWRRTGNRSARRPVRGPYRSRLLPGPGEVVSPPTVRPGAGGDGGQEARRDLDGSRPTRPGPRGAGRIRSAVPRTGPAAGHRRRPCGLPRGRGGCR